MPKTLATFHWPTWHRVRLPADATLCAFSFGIVALAAILVRKLMPFEFPVPWSDEAAYVSQAYALYKHGTFFVPALDQHRVVLWVPLGYETALAALFMLTGYSFGIARWFSCLLFIADAAMVIAIARRLLTGWPLAAFLLAAIATFLTPYVIVDSNIARTEALFLLVILGSLRRCLAGRPVGAGALVCTAAVLHFNAAFFVPPVAAYFAHALLARRRIVIDRLDWLLVGAAGLVLGSYGLYCLLHLQDFLYDMGFQFGGKAGLPFRATPTDLALCTLFATLGVAWLGDASATPAPAILMLYGAAFLLMNIIGNEMWYRYGLSLGVLLAVGGALARLRQTRPRESRVGLLALAAMLAFGIRHYVLESSPNSAPLAEMISKSSLAKGDRKKVNAFIEGLPRGSTVSFAKGFNGIEPFFFGTLDRAGVTWLMQRPSADRPGPERSTDWRVRCDSSLYARLLNPNEEGDFPREGRDTGCTELRWHPQ